MWTVQLHPVMMEYSTGTLMWHSHFHWISEFSNVVCFKISGIFPTTWELIILGCFVFSYKQKVRFDVALPDFVALAVGFLIITFIRRSFSTPHDEIPRERFGKIAPNSVLPALRTILWCNIRLNNDVSKNYSDKFF